MRIHGSGSKRQNINQKLPKKSVDITKVEHNYLKLKKNISYFLSYKCLQDGQLIVQGPDHEAATAIARQLASGQAKLANLGGKQVQCTRITRE